MTTIEIYKEIGEQIKTATAIGENTAERIGNAFLASAELIENAQTAADRAVTTEKISDKAVTAEKIADKAVTEEKINPDTLIQLHGAILFEALDDVNTVLKSVVNTGLGLETSNTCRLSVIKRDPGMNNFYLNVGVLDVWTQEHLHSIVQVFTTNYVLADGVFSSHTIDSNSVYTYTRHYTPSSSAWSSWRIATTDEVREMSVQVSALTKSIGQPDGIAPLDKTGKIGNEYLPENIGESLVIGETEGTAYEGNRGVELETNVASLRTEAFAGATARFAAIIDTEVIVRQMSLTTPGGRIVFVKSAAVFAYEMRVGLGIPSYYSNWNVAGLPSAELYNNAGRNALLKDKIYICSDNDKIYLWSESESTLIPIV